MQAHFIKRLDDGGVVLHGAVFGHGQFPDGKDITTSSMVKLTFPDFALEREELKTLCFIIPARAAAVAEPEPPQAHGGRAAPPPTPGGVN